MYCKKYSGVIAFLYQVYTKTKKACQFVQAQFETKHERAREYLRAMSDGRSPQAAVPFRVSES